MPLNIDWQQILLHWLNLAILTGGLYFLLYKPVKEFMTKREAHYRSLDEAAAAKLAEAERIKAECQDKLDKADEEIRQERAKAQQSTEDQLAQARAQARQIVTHAQTEAEHSRERILRESQRELRKLAAQATKKLAFHADPFDQFLDLAEEEEEHEE